VVCFSSFQKQLVSDNPFTVRDRLSWDQTQQHGHLAGVHNCVHARPCWDAIHPAGCRTAQDFQVTALLEQAEFVGCKEISHECFGMPLGSQSAEYAMGGESRYQ